MSCVILYKRKRGWIDMVGLDQENGFGPTEFIDRASACKRVVEMGLPSDCDWWEIVPLPSHTPTKPVSPTR